MPSNFENDFPAGLAAEDEIASLFGGERGSFGSAYDIRNSRLGNLEVKRDFAAARTGNIAIEESGNRNEPSGITVTQADHWVQVLDDRILVFQVGMLRAFAAQTKFRRRPSNEGAMNVLIPTSQAADIAVEKHSRK